jgi:hypothetical protein
VVILIIVATTQAKPFHRYPHGFEPRITPPKGAVMPGVGDFVDRWFVDRGYAHADSLSLWWIISF